MRFIAWRFLTRSRSRSRSFQFSANFTPNHCQTLQTIETYSFHPCLNKVPHKTFSSGKMNVDQDSQLKPNEIENKSISTDCESVCQHAGSKGERALSKKTLKRIARAEKYKDLKKKRKAENLKLTQKNDAGYSIDDFDQSSYYFENGLRKVYPYNFVFATFTKGRWVGRTIENVLQKEFGYDHEDDLMKAFDAGDIHVNNKPVGPNYKLRDCDYLSHRTHRHENPVTWAPIEIIKDTEDLVVINKPSSIPCHPCGRYRFNSVVFILGKELGYTNLRNIYRLDRLTSGVLILAKTMEMTKTLEDQVVNRQVQKEYVCRVVGKFPDGPILVDQPLRPLSNKLRLQVVCTTGKASQTEFSLVSYNGKSSVVRCRPFTGRTHQIRVHLQYLGHPIINDAFYNNPAWGPGGGKDGVYPVPFEQVCETILKEHHANLWDGGENPLYFEKVKEMKQKQEKSAIKTTTEPQHNPDVDSTARLDAMSTVKVPHACAETSDNVSNVGLEEPNKAALFFVQSQLSAKEQDSKESRTDGASVHKKPGEICSTEQNQKEVSPITAQDIRNRSLMEASQPSTVCQPDIDTTTDPGQTSMSINEGCGISRQSLLAPVSDHYESATTSCPILSSSAEHSVQIVPGNGHVSPQLSTGQGGGGAQPSKLQSLPPRLLEGRPGFEMDKWSIDLSCELCKKLPIEPREKDLVMFLHALKYKGLGWEYETELPDWASDDWNREEDYI